MATKKTKPANKAPSASDKLNAIGIEAICKDISDGISLRGWSIANGFVQQTVINWIDADVDRAGHYARAREAREDGKFESLEEIGEQAARAKSAVEVAGLRLKADNLKWMLARMSPKKYGDKLEVDQKTELKATVEVSTRPQLTKEEWMAAHGLGAATGGAK